jgi:hypothetical protein
MLNQCRLVRKNRIEIGQIIIGESLCFGALVVQKSSATNTLRHQIFTKKSLTKWHCMLNGKLFQNQIVFQFQE